MEDSSSSQNMNIDSIIEPTRHRLPTYNSGSIDSALLPSLEDVNSESPQCNRENQMIQQLSTGLQIGGTSLQAAERLKEKVQALELELQHGPLVGILNVLIKEGPGTAVAGVCMSVLAEVAKTPKGRTKIRTEGGIGPVVRFISMAKVNHTNILDAVTLVMNMALDDISRQVILEGDGVRALLILLGDSTDMKISNVIAGALVNILLGSDQRLASFCEGDGVAVLMRHMANQLSQGSPIEVRLQLILSQVARIKGMEEKLKHLAAIHGLVWS